MEEHGNLSNVAGAGHRLTGDGLRVYPVNHLLRHYMVLSEAHALSKYLPRRWGQEELARGWHRKRQNLTADRLLIPARAPYFATLPHAQSKDFKRERPSTQHYWHWRDAPVAE